MSLRVVSSSDDRALALRDHILPLLRHHGAVGVQRDTVRLTEFRTGPWLFQHWTPFSALGTEEASSPGYRHAVERQRAIPTLPYGLDVWQDDKNLLRVLWSDSGATVVDCFVRGPWEDEILLLA